MLVIGATGLAGRQIVEEALNSNFLVTCLAPDIDELDLKQQNVHLEKGDVFNLHDLRRVMHGQDIIVDAFNTDSCNKAGCDRAHALENIIQIMKEMSLKRIIVVAGAGIAQFKEDKLMCEMPNFPQELQEITKDHLRVWRRLQQSGLDYTVFAAPTILQEGQQQQWK